MFSFEDSFEIFKGIPAEVSEISDAFEPFIFGGGTRKLDFASIISFLKERGEDPEVITWLKIQQESGNDIDEVRWLFVT